MAAILLTILRFILQIARQKAAVFTERVRDFLQSLPANAGVKPWNNSVQTVFRRVLRPRGRLPAVPEASFFFSNEIDQNNIDNLNLILGRENRSY